MHTVFCPAAWQLSWDIPADAGSLRHDAAMLGDTIKETSCITLRGERKEMVCRATCFVVSSVEVTRCQHCSLARAFKEMVS